MQLHAKGSKPPRLSQDYSSSVSIGDFSFGHGLGQTCPSLHQPLDDESSALTHYYFTKVCRIAGCFNSDVSPFRIVAASMMAYSKPVFLLLQASSAVLLSGKYPKMRLKALSLQSEAFSAVRTEIGDLKGPVVSDELMISTIIAGLTSAWYDVNDIGLSHVLGSQVLLFFWLNAQGKCLKYQQTFILGAYVYWFMISAFSAGDPWRSFHYQEALQEIVRSLEMSHDIVDDTNAPENLRKTFPHPLTGFSTQLYISMGKVGSLCRLRHSEIDQPKGLQNFLEEKAQFLESEFLDLVQSNQDNFQDPRDPQTTIDDILSVGEAYRCAGLLQLYATFPQLLQRHAQGPATNEAGNLDRRVPPEIETIRLNSIGRFTPLQHSLLRALAFHIVEILETIPAISGTRVLFGLPVLIAGAWLVDKIDMTFSDSNDCGNQTPFEHQRLHVVEPSSSKESSREIVREGLRRHSEYVGLQQVSRILEILEEVWRLDDSGIEKCHWMLVVASKGLQTLYG
jgi:hypothetical protein